MQQVALQSVARVSGIEYSGTRHGRALKAAATLRELALAAAFHGRRSTLTHEACIA